MTAMMDYMELADFCYETLYDLQGPWGDAKDCAKFNMTQVNAGSRMRTRKRRAEYQRALKGNYYPIITEHDTMIVSLDSMHNVVDVFDGAASYVQPSHEVVENFMRYLLKNQGRAWTLLTPLYANDGINVGYGVAQWRDPDLCPACREISLGGAVMSVGMLGQTKGRRGDDVLVPSYQSGLFWHADHDGQLGVYGLKSRRGDLHFTRAPEDPTAILPINLAMSATLWANPQRAVLTHPEHPNVVFTFGLNNDMVDHDASTLSTSSTLYDVFRAVEQCQPLTETELSDGWILLLPTRPRVTTRVSSAGILEASQRLSGLPIENAPAPAAPGPDGAVLGDPTFDAIRSLGAALIHGGK